MRNQSDYDDIWMLKTKTFLLVNLEEKLEEERTTHKFPYYVFPDVSPGQTDQLVLKCDFFGITEPGTLFIHFKFSRSYKRFGKQDSTSDSINDRIQEPLQILRLCYANLTTV